jgi:methylmalonyl-CoA/ethylmalonyl-CoA epimerase
MMVSDMKLSKIGQISMNAKDLARATAFYRDRLGLPYLFSAGTLAFFDCGGTRLMLGLAESPEFDHAGSVLYFNVSDIDAAYSTMKQRGVVFLGEPHLIAKMPDHELWMAFFRDSEDNTLAIMAERR